MTRALSSEPMDRPPTIAALIGELEQALQPVSEAPTAPPDESIVPPSSGSGSGSDGPAFNDSTGSRSSRSSLSSPSGEFPPGSVLVSWRAFALTVLLAAVVGALLAVAVMLLRRASASDSIKSISGPPVTLHKTFRPSHP